VGRVPAARVGAGSLSLRRRLVPARSATTPRIGTFRSFRYSDYRWWFTGQFFSQTGFWFYVVTQALLVLHLTDSGTMVGIVTAVQNIPLFVIAPYAGALTDRVDTRRLILTTQSVTTASSLALGVLVLTDVVTVTWVLVLAGVTGVAWAFDQPARRTFAAELVPEEAVTNALSLNGLLLQMARMVGPALAALVIASLGFGWCFVATGICTSVSLFVLVAIGRTGHVFRSDDPSGAKGSLAEGVRLAWRDRHVRVVLLLLFFTSTVAFNWNVLFPLFALRDLAGTSATYALLMASMAAGSIVGAFGLARRASVGGRLLAVGACVYGVAQVAMAVAPSVALAATAATCCGLGSMLLVNGGAANLQLHVAKGMRGRMMGLFTLAVLGGVGAGAPLSGLVAESFGTRVALAAGGTCAVAGGLLAMWMLRPMSARASRAGREP
jgi:MFS family permease